MSEPANFVTDMDAGSHLVEVEGTGTFTGAVTMRLRYRIGSDAAPTQESCLYTFSVEGARRFAKGLLEAAEEAANPKYVGPKH